MLRRWATGCSPSVPSSRSGGRACIASLVRRVRITSRYETQCPRDRRGADASSTEVAGCRVAEQDCPPGVLGRRQRSEKPSARRPPSQLRSSLCSQLPIAAFFASHHSSLSSSPPPLPPLPPLSLPSSLPSGWTHPGSGERVFLAHLMTGVGALQAAPIWRDRRRRSNQDGDRPSIPSRIARLGGWRRPGFQSSSWGGDRPARQPSRTELGCPEKRTHDGARQGSAAAVSHTSDQA